MKSNKSMTEWSGIFKLSFEAALVNDARKLAEIWG
jgi:hypothetical protein